ncbi:MAG: hypothetical protein ACK54K_14185, partial [Gemmatimonadaceae bacterium]
LKSAASLAKITGDYDVQEFPHPKTATERLTDLLEDKPTPAAALAYGARADAAVADAAVAGAAALAGRGAAGGLIRQLTQELQVLLTYSDRRGVYARLPYILRIQ